MKEYYLALGTERRGPFSLKDLKNEIVYPDSLLWKEGWQSWQTAQTAAIEVPAIELIINDKIKKTKPPLLSTSIGETQSQAADKDFSIIDSFYTKIANWLNQKLEKNTDQIGKSLFYTSLHRAKILYENLAENRQRGIRFFLNIAVCFFFSTLLFFSVSWGISITKAWIAFIALNQIKLIGGVINKLNEMVNMLIFMFLPEAVRMIMTRFGQNMSNLVLAYYLSWIIAPAYMIYRVVLSITDIDLLKSLED